MMGGLETERCRPRTWGCQRSMAKTKMATMKKRTMTKAMTEEPSWSGRIDDARRGVEHAARRTRMLPTHPPKMHPWFLSMSTGSAPRPCRRRPELRPRRPPLRPDPAAEGPEVPTSPSPRSHTRSANPPLGMNLGPPHQLPRQPHRSRPLRCPRPPWSRPRARRRSAWVPSDRHAHAPQCVRPQGPGTASSRPRQHAASETDSAGH